MRLSGQPWMVCWIFARRMTEESGEVKSIILSGNGKNFCAGLDMSSFAEIMSGDLSGNREDVVEALQDISAGGAKRAQ